MSSSSNIEWTDATWNPIVGCSIVSLGCTNCYAMKMAARIEAIHRAGSTDDNGYRVRAAPGAKTRDHYEGTTRKVNGNAVWTGKLALAPNHILTAPLRWKKPRKVFVNSMGDLFHENAPDEWIDKVFAVMALCPQHQFQVLTKRAERMRTYFNGPYPNGDGVAARIAEATWQFAPARSQLPEPPVVVEVPVGPRLHNGLPEFGFRRMMNPRKWPLPNVWLGVSAERQQEADERLPHLINTPAAVRFVSCEPLLGPIVLQHDDLRDGKVRNWLGAGGLDWIIVGGESGKGARSMHPDWARGLRDQCEAAGVPFFFKQWGEWTGVGQVGDTRGLTGSEPLTKWTDGRQSVRVGKKAAGRLLDGKEHNGFPG